MDLPLVQSPQPGNPHLQRGSPPRLEVTYKLPSPLRQPHLDLYLSHLYPRSRNKFASNNENQGPVIEGLEYIDSISAVFPDGKWHGYLHERYFWILYEPYRGLMTWKPTRINKDEESTEPLEDGFEDYGTNQNPTIGTSFSELSPHHFIDELPHNGLFESSNGAAQTAIPVYPCVQPLSQAQQLSWASQFGTDSVTHTFTISPSLATLWKKHLASVNGGRAMRQIHQSVVYLPNIHAQTRFNHLASRDTMIQ